MRLLAAILAVAFSAPGHAPRINVHWPYTVRATEAGKPAAARLTVQIVDPIGGVHAAARGSSTKKIVNWPFRGVFRDYLVWPAESRGLRFTVRVTVVAGRQKRVLKYVVTPRS